MVPAAAVQSLTEPPSLIDFSNPVQTLRTNFEDLSRALIDRMIRLSLVPTRLTGVIRTTDRASRPEISNGNYRRFGLRFHQTNGGPVTQNTSDQRSP